jgi:sterol regulatory element-binding transcription factor 1
MLVYGDPVIYSKSKPFTTYWRHRKQADYDLSNVSNFSLTTLSVRPVCPTCCCCVVQGKNAAANEELRRCLQAFGKPFPASRLELLLGTMWQVARQGLHRMWVGRWLARKCGGVLADSARRREAQNSAKELATVYHRLHQLHLVSMRGQHGGLMLALSAANLGEAAADVLPAEILADIYVAVALRIKESCPTFLHVLSR